MQMQKTLYEMFKMFVNHILFERGIFYITTTYLVLLDSQCRPTNRSILSH